jgi:uncharacterized protein YecE (DUF72 family)
VSDLFAPASQEDRTPAVARRRKAEVRVEPAMESPLLAAPALPPEVRLGASSWFFPGWQGLVYAARHSESELSKAGLRAYAQIPLLRTVSLDRTFYGLLERSGYERYAEQVPAGFRFVVKAPAAVTDALQRGEGGRSVGPNPTFLDPMVAIRGFVEPCVAGLGAKAGPLVFQMPPLPRSLADDAPALVARLREFFASLPRTVAGIEPGVRYCIGLHARMPGVDRQIAALRALDGQPSEGPYEPQGAVVVRWNLHPGFVYEQAKDRYRPFDRLVDPDPATRGVLARLAVAALKARKPVWITANNKAEGSGVLTVLELARAIDAELAVSDGETAR